MHFFSRKKMLLTVSLAALGGLAACGDDVVVPVQQDPVVILMTPQNAALNIGDVQTFAVQITGGSTTTPATLASCTSSNSAVATATKSATLSACTVTAVSSGSVTITAATSSSPAAVTSSSVTVSAKTNAASNLTLSPATSNLAPQQTVTITPNVTKADPAVTVTYAYTSSNTSVATVPATGGTNGSVVVTALAQGTTTIVATATASGTGFSTSTLTQSATVTVGAAPAGLTGLSVTPGSLSMAVGRTGGLTSAITRPTGAPNYTITYTSSNPAVATVTKGADSTTAIVTAIATGNANITVKASTAGNATYAAADLIQVVPVTVLSLANVSIQAINQGPTVTSLIDSAYGPVATNPGPGNFPIGATSGTGVIAGIRKLPNAQLNLPIDVTNTKDQIQVILNLQPNGQRVDSVVVYVDSGFSGTTTVKRAAARQVFTNGDAGTGATVPVELFLLTDDFTTNDVTGNGDVHFVNGLKRISASVWTTLATGQFCGTVAATNNTTPCELQNAANIRQNVNFNNIDGFALKMTRPANSATDAASRTWWGGPTVSDIGQPSGLGSFQAYPVIFTPGRSIQHVSATFGRCLGFQSPSGLPNVVTDSAGPWIFTYGSGAPATPPTSSKHIACAVVGAYDAADQFRFEDYPMVVASLDNSNNPGPRTIYAYNPSTGTDAFGGPRPSLFRSSPQLVNPDPIRVDYQAPNLTLAVTQSNGERWVNDAYLFNTNYTATDFIDATLPVTGVGVGLFATPSSTSDLRNTIFRVASANPACGPQTFQDVNSGIGTRRTASIAQVFSIAPNTNRESPCDFTNNAFVAQATETDRLGNRGTIGNTQFSTTTGGVTTITTATPLFGIDNTAPDLIVPFDGAGPIADMPNIYRATGDSIFQPVNGAVAATPVAQSLPAGTPANATDFLFGARYTDTRAGFNITNHGTRTVKRFAPNATPLLTNRAVVTTVATRTMNFVGAQGNPVENEDPIFRRDSLTIYGAGPISGTTGSTLAFTANPLPGYYQYNLTVTDRAGNSSTLQERAVIDQTSPIVTGTTIPPVFGATGTGVAVAQTFFPTGTDDVEAVDWDLMLRYNALSMVGDSSSGSTIITDGARMRFRRDRFANLHNAWAVFGDTLLATPFGPAAFLSGTGMTLPIPSIRGIEPVDSTDAPVAYGQVGVVNPFTGFKPNKVGVYGFDVRATHVSQGAPYGWPAPYASSLPFVSLGMTNLFPTLAPSGGEAGYTENLFVGNISNGAMWDTKDLNPATTGTDRLVAWSGFGGTGSNIEFRAITSTIVTQPPFPMVHLFKWEVDAQHTGTGLGVNETTLNDSASGNWVYVGTLNASAPSNPVINDQGSTRFWRYGFSSSAFPSVTNGMIVQPGVTTGCYRAVGVDASGDGITTKSFGLNCPVAGGFANQTQVVASATNMTLTLRAYGNGTGTVAIAAAPALTLTKSSANGVERVSQNRPNIGATIVITPNAGTTVDRAPTGCTLVGAPVFPTSAAFSCTYTVFTPGTVTVIFEAPGAGGP
ncbi:MAG: Ig-like domain-containing protein [Gemmatimonadaceae bacterium]